jgi:hypothetical protein
MLLKKYISIFILAAKYILSINQNTGIRIQWKMEIFAIILERFK